MFVSKTGERLATEIGQISVGGCLVKAGPSVFVGDEFRLEIELPNGNRLPVRCKAVYKFDDLGIGAKFLDITRFEQELVSRTIAHRLDQEGLPPNDPFSQPSTYIDEGSDL